MIFRLLRVGVGAVLGWSSMGAEEPFVLPPPSELGIDEGLEASESGPVLLPDLSTVPSANLPDDLYEFPPARIHLEEFKFEGNTVFSDQELAEVVKEFAGRDLDFNELEAARGKVTMHYVRNGYVNSGAVLPDQEISGGVVTMTIVEGTLTGIVVDNNRWLRDRFFADRIRVATPENAVLNMKNLRPPLALLHRNKLVKRLDAQIKPGAKPGESYLAIDVAEESPPVWGGVEFSNTRPASVGEEQIEFWMKSPTFLTKMGDMVEFRYGLLDQGLQDATFGAFKNYSVAYSLPITEYDTTLLASYQQSSYTVLEEPLNAFDFDGNSSRWQVGVRQPFRSFSPAEIDPSKNWEQEFALGLYFNRARSETSLAGVPFNLTPGAVNGETELSVVRFTLDYARRNQVQALAARSTFSVGLDIGDITDDGTNRDGRFLAWLGQVLYARRLFPDADHPILSRTQAILRGSIQLASDPLLAPEQMSIGGLRTVRGYRENELVRDEGYLSSLEFHVPVWQSDFDRDILTLVPFVDVGGGWNKKVDGQTGVSDRSDTIVSAGIGLLFSPCEYFDLEFYWGHAFSDFPSSGGDSLQEDGFHFRVTTGRF